MACERAQFSNESNGVKSKHSTLSLLACVQQPYREWIVLDESAAPPQHNPARRKVRRTLQCQCQMFRCDPFFPSKKALSTRWESLFRLGSAPPTLLPPCP